MVKLKEITDFLYSFCPDYLAEDYDNVGLLIEGTDDEIERVLVSLDTDDIVADEASEKGCQLIVSHHPLIFKPIKRVAKDDAVSKIIRNNISLYSMHTNYDAKEGGLCDALLLKIAQTQNVFPLVEGQDGALGRIADLKSEMTLSEFAENVKKELSLDILRVVGDRDKMIKTVAICGGGGGDFVYDALSKGADLYISGDFKYHHARLAFEKGMALLEISHYDAEILFIDEVKKLLSKEFGSRLEVIKSEKNINPWNVI
ncbi:MAG: Nif3-like dinuclear metal center hexameric protein [Ruminococcaceae bacterium]|nr:Nif3-like dinuclear metal center hexameric protein [Oscillospiraceae bacterium]